MFCFSKGSSNQISVAMGANIFLVRVSEWSVLIERVSKTGLEELQQIHRNEPHFDLAPTPRPTLTSNKEAL